MNKFLRLSSKLLLVVALLAVTFAGTPAASQADSLRDVGLPSKSAPEAQPEKVIVSGAVPGNYYLDYGYTVMDPAQYPVDGAIRFWGWSALNPASGVYNWAALDSWIAARRAIGLEAGIMLTTYDGVGAGDIRSTPDYVIQKQDAVLAAYAQGSPSTPEYVNYWPPKRANYNATFDASDHNLAWNKGGSVTIMGTPPADPTGEAYGWAAQFGGVNDATGQLYHSDERIPAMPTSLAGTDTAHISFRVYAETTDPNPNDHLYAELWDSSNNRIGTAQLDINNLDSPGTWKTYSFDVSSIAPGRSIRVAFKVVTDSANPTTFYVDNVFPMVRHLMPYYHGKTATWTSTKTSPYLDAYKTFIQALGDHLKNDPDMQFIAIGTGLFGENQPVDNQYDYMMTDAGMTSAIWIEYVNEVSKKHASAFVSIPGQGPNRHLVLQYAPTFKSVSERVITTDFAGGLGIGMSSNFLAPDYLQSYKDDGTGAYDPILKWWQRAPIAFESYSTDLCNPVLAYWAAVSGLDKHVDYLRVAETLLRSNGQPTVNVPIFAWARQYVGKTTQDTPSVWVVMREHRNPTRSNCRPDGLWYLRSASGNYTIGNGSGATWPELGNYTYWLYQVDSIPGGITVPETNDKGADSRYARDPGTGAAMPEAGLGNCPNKSYNTALFGENYPCNYQPYNPDLPVLEGQNPSDYRDFYDLNLTGAGKEAYIVRRTDQNVVAAKNNPFMFFMIDNEYIKGDASYQVKITVKYFDIGTDKWQLKYDSTGGEKAAVAPDGKNYIQKTGTKELKEVTFTILDGRFAGRLTGGADFYLDSRAPDGTLDGNEWVHMVDVAKQGSQPQATETPTVTPTPTQTATPTVTPTATPTTGSVEGVAFADTDGDGSKGPGEPGLPGAVMALKLFPANTDAYTATSGADGVFRFTAVTPGQYTLVEKSPPPGYLPTTQIAMVFQVKANDKLTGFNAGHQPQATATPTATPTATATATLTATPTTTPTATFTPPIIRYTYLPLVLK